jgi:hypothetical protein
LDGKWDLIVLHLCMLYMESGEVHTSLDGFVCGGFFWS